MVTPGAGETIADHGATPKPATGPRLAHRNLRSRDRARFKRGPGGVPARGPLGRRLARADVRDRALVRARHAEGVHERPHRRTARARQTQHGAGLLLSSVPGGHKRYFPELADRCAAAGHWVGRRSSASRSGTTLWLSSLRCDRVAGDLGGGAEASRPDRGADAARGARSGGGIRGNGDRKRRHPAGARRGRGRHA